MGAAARSPRRSRGGPSTGTTSAERHPWAFTDGQRGRGTSTRSSLRTPEGVVLVDSVWGASGRTRRGPQEHPDPWSSLDRGAVDHLVLTHLHADHAGGSVLDRAPRFPNATYHVHPGDWTFFAGVEDDEEYVARQALEVVAVASEASTSSPSTTRSCRA